MSNVINTLLCKGNKKGWDSVNTLINEARADASYYQEIPDIVPLLSNSLPFVRLKAFLFLVSISKWDKEKRIIEYSTQLLAVLNDSKPAFVRVALRNVCELINNQPDFKDLVIGKFTNYDYSIYSESMLPLIRIDVDNVLRELNS